MTGESKREEDYEKETVNKIIELVNEVESELGNRIKDVILSYLMEKWFD